MTDIVFLDTETLGLDVDAPIWEVAAIRRDGNTGAETKLHVFINVDPHPWLSDLPDEFADDYRKRSFRNRRRAVDPTLAAVRIHKFLDGRPHIVGAVPDFDTTRIRHQLLRPLLLPDPWHYHLTDVENIVVGYLAGRGQLIAPPWKSEALSASVGVNPDDYARHTAMGDVRWVRAQWDAVMCRD